ncbi:MAG: pyrroline-5-carboxylate reductase [Chakrabartia sp.]
MIDEGAIWLIGCGNMGGAMLRGWLADGIDAARITVIDPHLKTVPDGVRLLSHCPTGEAPPAMALLAVKPQSFRDVATAIAPALGDATLLISILAGIEVATLRKYLVTPRGVIRVMPNMPAAIGKGITILYADAASHADAARAANLMAPLGSVEWITDERQFDAVTALSGSGPAFVFRFIDALAQAGAALGLPTDQALRLALATVEGSAALAGQSAETPSQLAERVASPNGTTRAGLDVLDEGDTFSNRVGATLAAAAHRSAELAASARDE